MVAVAVVVVGRVVANSAMCNLLINKATVLDFSAHLFDNDTYDTFVKKIYILVLDYSTNEDYQNNA